MPKPVHSETHLDEWLYAQSGRLDVLLDKRAVDLWRHSPIRSLRGGHRVSAECNPIADRYRTLAWLILDNHARFLELLNYLPNFAQDVMIQFYVLGRTQTRIGELAGQSQTVVWQTLEAATWALCGVIMKERGIAASDRNRKKVEKAEATLRKREMKLRTGMLTREGKELDAFHIADMNQLRGILTSMTTEGSLYTENVNGGA